MTDPHYEVVTNGGRFLTIEHRNGWIARVVAECDDYQIARAATEGLNYDQLKKLAEV